MEEKQSCLFEPSDCDLKTLFGNAIPENTKKSAKYAVNVFEGKESCEQTFRFTQAQTETMERVTFEVLPKLRK